nr:hypothetical protein CFP56_42115 [Quercus suber]
MGQLSVLRAWSYLFSVMQALEIVLKYRSALGFSGVIFRVGVHDVAGEDFLPERKAPGRTCGAISAFGALERRDLSTVFAYLQSDRIRKP